jgi:hypothetical protein
MVHGTQSELVVALQQPFPLEPGSGSGSGSGRCRLSQRPVLSEQPPRCDRRWGRDWMTARKARLKICRYNHSALSLPKSTPIFSGEVQHNRSIAHC